MKTMTLRIEDVQARELELAARADRIPVSSFVRDAIEAQIAARRSDDGFKERLRGMMEEDREILERLAQ